MRPHTLISWALGSVLSGSALLGACGGEAEKPPENVECNVPKLFEQSCAGNVCHSGRDPEDLDLVSSGLDERLLGVPASEDCQEEGVDPLLLVDPGNPEGSFLYQKLTQAKPSCGKHMPQGADELSQAELECVKDYILDARGGPSCETCGTLICTDLQTDEAHCGTCDVACVPGLQCAAGVCINPCTSSETLCGSVCADVTEDPLNCGRCGHRCAPGTTCTEGACACDADLPVVSFKTDVLPIFERSCTGKECHSGSNQVTTLNLEEGMAYAQLVEVPSDGEGCTQLRVDPNKPDDSFLIDKVMGGDLCYGKRMPRSDEGLADESTARLVSWICAGAAKN